MTALTFLISLTAGTLGINLLGVFTKWANDYRNKLVIEATTAPPLLLEGQNSASEQALHGHRIPDEETAGFWWKRLLTLKGMAGFVFSPLQLPILIINSYIIALNLETVFARVPPPLFTLTIWQWEREVNIFDLYGLLCSLGQMITASLLDQVVKQERGKEARWFQTLLAWITASALVSLVAFEVGSSIYRGSVLGGTSNAALSGALAAGVAALEIVVGIFILDFFFLPLFLALLWFLATPMRSLARAWETVRRALRGRPRSQKPRPNRLSLAMVYLLAAIEQGIMLPLRRLDELVLRFLLTKKREWHQSGYNISGSLLKKVVAAAILVAVLASLLGCQGIVSAPKPPIVWVIGLDITTSIPKDRFLILRDEVMPRIVLSRVRARDEVHILPVNSDPEENVKVFRVSGKRLGIDTEITAIYGHVQSHLDQPHRYSGTTNIGGVLAYAKRMSQLVEKEQRAKRMGKVDGSLPLFVVVVFTDGKLEGTQSRQAGEWPKNVVVSFWGIDPRHEGQLRKWATADARLAEDQINIVRMSDWESVANMFGRTIDRPSANLEVMEKLNLAKSTAGVVERKPQTRRRAP